MRHGKIGSNFGRPSAQRKALFRNLIISLVEHEHIKTTLPKARELRRFAEKMITLAKQDTVARRRIIFDRLRSRKTVTKLFNDIAPHFQSRPGGYLRILKCGYRHGDSAPMAYVQMVDRDLNKNAVDAEAN